MKNVYRAHIEITSSPEGYTPFKTVYLNAENVQQAIVILNDKYTCNVRSIALEDAELI